MEKLTLEQTQILQRDLMPEEELLQKISFTDIFTILPNNGGLSTKQWIEVNGSIFPPNTTGWTLGGVNFQLYLNYDIAAVLRQQADKSVYVIKGFYAK